MDINSQVLSSGDTPGSYHDFQAGPVMLNPLDYSLTTQQFERVWKITRNEVEFHIQHFTDPGYIVPSSINDWPGNYPLGSAGNSQLAPYFDVNNNGIYDPVNGDYPRMKGDEAIWFVRNADTVHTSTNSQAQRLEVHYLVYVFSCSNDSILERTVFADIKMLNLGTITYYNGYFGLYNDFDLGDPADDFVGTDIQRGMVYAVNGDSIDGTYGGTCPAFGMVMLGGPYQDDDALDNPFSSNISIAIDSAGIPYEGLGLNYGNNIIDDERMGLRKSIVPNAIFGNALEMHNLLSSIFTDGTALYYGGTGYYSSPGVINNGSVNCNFIYSSDSDTMLFNTSGVSVIDSDWSEYNNANMPGDRRIVASAGPVTVAPGEINEINLAWIYSRDDQNGSQSLNYLKQSCDLVRNYYLNDTTSCTSSFTVSNLVPNSIFERYSDNQLKLFPNPNTGDFSLQLPDEFNSGIIEVYNITGEIVRSINVFNQNIVSLSNFDTGIYLIRFIGEGKFYTCRVIVK